MMQTITARIHDAQPAQIVDSFTEFARLLDIEPRQTAGALSLQLSAGRIGVVPEGSGLDVTLEAQTGRQLYLLQQLVLNRLDRLDPVPRLDWAHVDEGALPPNLTLATVVHIRQISPNFRRVRLTFDDVARYAVDGLHFRFVISALPPDEAQGGSVLRWPVIDASGRTNWPDGDLALHRPVYTVREIDADAGWMDFDIYIHAGGRVSAWAERATPGDVIGLMGPTTMKRDFPGWVAFFGDETSLPAIALYLARLPQSTTGVAVIALADQADRQVIQHPPGITLRWIERTSGAVADAIRATPLPETDRFVYVGAESAEAEAARIWLRETKGLTRGESNVTAFWSAGQGTDA